MNHCAEKTDKHKNQAEFQRNLWEIAKREEALVKSMEGYTQQKKNLYFQDDLTNTEKQNTRLRAVLNKAQNEDIETRMDREKLKKIMMEADFNGKIGKKQFLGLKDTNKCITNENICNSANTPLRRTSDPTAKSDLADKLSEFEQTNKSLRQMLQEHHVQSMDTDRQRDQIEMLLLKISEYESRCQKFSLEILEKDRTINELQTHVQGQSSESAQMANVIKSMENQQDQLTRQLTNKDEECGNLIVRVTRLEANLSEAEGQKDTIILLNNQLSDEIEEKEKFKKTCIMFQNKCMKYEATVLNMSNDIEAKVKRIMEIDQILAETRKQIAPLESTNAQQHLDIQSLKKQVEELDVTFKNSQIQAQRRGNELMAQIEVKTEQLSLAQSENEKLDSELTVLRTSMQQYEELVEEYKEEMQKTRREAEMTAAQLEHEQAHAAQIQLDAQCELHHIKQRLQTRLNELEPLPAMLVSAETKLESYHTRQIALEQRNHENTNLIAELSVKLELQHDEFQNSKNKTCAAQDHNRSLMTQNETLERKVADTEKHNKELTFILSQRDQSLLANNARMDEMGRDTKNVAYQLETAMSDLRRQTDLYREACSREKIIQSRVAELERDFTDTKTQNIELKSEKDKIRNAMDFRLSEMNKHYSECAENNAGLLKYVSFLKHHHAGVYGDICAHSNV